jgi:hypothetical protein
MLLYLKTRWFNKWALKQSLTDRSLKIAIDNLETGSGVTNLGGSLFKIRISREGEGKRGGYRALIAYKNNDRVVFLFAFAKKEKDNITHNELKALKKLAVDIINLETTEVKRQIDLGNLIELEVDQ